MAGYWPSSFCVFIDRGEVEVHEYKRRANVSLMSRIERRYCLAKYFIYDLVIDHFHTTSYMTELYVFRFTFTSKDTL